jgi:L-alanine-DL-glutamate epimerase-like enolase superfamily enzyme
VGPCLYQADVTRERARFEDGDLVVPDGPGLGVDVDMDKVEAIRSPLSSLNDVTTNFTRG